jgi:hypothetical protein
MGLTSVPIGESPMHTSEECIRQRVAVGDHLRGRATLGETGAAPPTDTQEALVKESEYEVGACGGKLRRITLPSKPHSSRISRFWMSPSRQAGVEW